MRGRSTLSTFAAVLALSFVTLTAPPPTVACSCAMLDEPMRAAAAGDDSVFTGVAGPLEPNGVRVTLTRWFHGAPPPSGVAVLDPAGFVDPMGGSCGTNPPGFGEEWIFVAGRNDVGRYGVGLCSVMAALDTDVGQVHLADATRVFGPPIVPEAAAPPGDDDPWAALGAMAPLGVGLVAAIVAVVSLFALAGRRRRAGI